MSRIALSALSFGALLIATPVFAQPAAAPAPAAADAPPALNDYGVKANWLCWPGRADACETDLTTTVVKADGSTHVEAFKADPKAPIDCFFFYDTATTEKGIIS